MVALWNEGLIDWFGVFLRRVILDVLVERLLSARWSVRILYTS